MQEIYSRVGGTNFFVSEVFSEKAKKNCLDEVSRQFS